MMYVSAIDTILPLGNIVSMVSGHATSLEEVQRCVGYVKPPPTPNQPLTSAGFITIYTNRLGKCTLQVAGDCKEVLHT